VTVDSSEDGYTLISPYIPKSQCVVFGNGEQQVGIGWMKFQLVDGVAMSYGKWFWCNKKGGFQPYFLENH